MGKSKDLASGNSAAYVETAGDTMTGALTINRATSGTNLNVVVPNGQRFNQVDFKNGTSQKGAIWTDDQTDLMGYYTPSSWGMNFYTGGTERMKIDSSGRVTMPSQPCFIAYTNSSFASVANSNTIARNINGTYANVGSHYSTSGATASRFTAPVAGKYHFGFQFLLSNVASSDDSIHVSFHKNGSNDQYANARYEGEAANGNLGFGGYLPIIGTTVQNLAANDYIEINVYSSGSIWLYQSSSWSRYYGYLIG